MSPEEEVAASALTKLVKEESSQVEGTETKPSGSKTRRKKIHKYPVEPVLIQNLPKRKGVIDHTYADFSIVPPTLEYEPKTSIEDMTFSEKVHHILSNPKNEKLIRWMPHGRAFTVAVPVAFERTICQEYFGHKRYSSFLRQLNNHGFKHISKGTDRNCYYHECMIKNMPHLCAYMPEARDARRLVPDPENEPDFYKISAACPPPSQVGQVGVPLTSALSSTACARAPTNSSSVLQARLASEVPWLQVPPAKRSAAAVPSAALASLPQTLLAPQQNQQQLVSLLGGAVVPQQPTDVSALLRAVRQQRQAEELQRAATSQAAVVAQILRLQSMQR